MSAKEIVKKLSFFNQRYYNKILSYYFDLINQAPENFEDKREENFRTFSINDLSL